MASTTTITFKHEHTASNGFYYQNNNRVLDTHDLYPVSTSMKGKVLPIVTIIINDYQASQLMLSTVYFYNKFVSTIIPKRLGYVFNYEYGIDIKSPYTVHKGEGWFCVVIGESSNVTFLKNSGYNMWYLDFDLTYNYSLL